MACGAKRRAVAQCAKGPFQPPPTRCPQSEGEIRRAAAYLQPMPGFEEMRRRWRVGPSAVCRVSVGGGGGGGAVLAACRHWRCTGGRCVLRHEPCGTYMHGVRIYVSSSYHAAVCVPQTRVHRCESQLSPILSFSPLGQLWLYSLAGSVAPTQGTK
jgi:hypothetical protein